MNRGALALVAVSTLVGCIDQGEVYVPDAAPDAMMDVDAGMEAGEGGGDAQPEGGAASENVMVIGVNNAFTFTNNDTMKPTGADPHTFYVKVGTLVHFTLQTSPNEEAHTFRIVVPNDMTPDGFKMGQPGQETHLDWTAPTTPATFPGGVICTVHADMKSDLVVQP